MLKIHSSCMPPEHPDVVLFCNAAPHKLAGSPSPRGCCSSTADVPGAGAQNPPHFSAMDTTSRLDAALAVTEQRVGWQRGGACLVLQYSGRHGGGVMERGTATVCTLQCYHAHRCACNSSLVWQPKKQRASGDPSPVTHTLSVPTTSAFVCYHCRAWTWLCAHRLMRLPSRRWVVVCLACRCLHW